MIRIEHISNCMDNKDDESTYEIKRLLKNILKGCPGKFISAHIHVSDTNKSIYFDYIFVFNHFRFHCSFRVKIYRDNQWDIFSMALSPREFFGHSSIPLKMFQSIQDKEFNRVRNELRLPCD